MKRILGIFLFMVMIVWFGSEPRSDHYFSSSNQSGIRSLCNGVERSMQGDVVQ